MIVVALVLLFVVSFILGLRSMQDFEMPQEVKKLLKFKKIQGTIMFLKEKVTHYKS